MAAQTAYVVDIRIYACEKRRMGLAPLQYPNETLARRVAYAVEHHGGKRGNKLKFRGVRGPTFGGFWKRTVRIPTKQSLAQG